MIVWIFKGTIYNKYELPYEILKYNNIKKIIVLTITITIIILSLDGNMFIFYRFTDKTKKIVVKNVYDIWYDKIDRNIYYLKYNGKLYCNNRYDLCNDILLKKPYMIDKNFNYIIDTNIDLKWYPINHIKYGKNFNNNVLKLLLFLKFYKSIKIPKYVIYIIIDFLR